MFSFDAAFRAELRGNWLVLLIAFATFMFGFSAPAYTLPFVFPEVIHHFGWTREQAMLLASSKYLIGAVCALLVGGFVDRIGAWVSLIVCVALGGIALLSFLWIETLTTYYLLGILLGFASGGTMVAVKVLISRAFHHSQATAMGAALIGSVIGSVILPFAIGGAISSLGWRGGIAAMSAGIWLVALPLLLFGLVSPAMAFGRRPTREALAASAAADLSTNAATLRRVFADRNFWLIGIAIFIVAATDMAFTQHQVLIYDDAGISRYWAEIGISAIGVFGVVTRLIVGNILDTTSNKGLSILWLMLTGSILMAFALTSPILFIGYIIFRATGHSAAMLDTITMSKHVWGPFKGLGTLLGLYTAIASLGFALGPWLMGRLHDMSGSYNSAYILFAVLPVVSSLLIWQVEPVFWRKLKAGKVAPDGAGVSAIPSAGAA
jgi:MFS family permease